MKEQLICVDTGRVPHLTLHKIYDGFVFHPLGENSTIKVVDDSGYVKTYKAERFMRLSRYRQTKLKELGI
jgi:hypothetical protein